MTQLPLSPPWLSLALTAARPKDRAHLACLLELDARLGKVVSSSSEPMLGQIRLAWWRDSLTSPTPPKGEPLIAQLTALRDQLDWPIADPLQQMILGWETRLLSPDAVTSFAEARGGGLFAAFAGPDPIPGLPAAASSWALADIDDSRAAPIDMAALRRWPRRLRPLSLLALAGQVEGRMAGVRLSWHGLTGH